MIEKSDFKNIISKDKIEAKLDLSRILKGVESDRKRDISAKIARALREAVGDDAVNKAQSSVTGKKFKKLSKAYQKIKKAQGKGGKANLVLDGDMLGALRESNGVQTVTMKIKGEKEILKAYNHFTGDTLPKRQALPDEGEAFRPGIIKILNGILKDEL